MLANKIAINIPKDLNFFEIEKIKIEDIKPLLIKIKGIKKDNLIQENGYDGEEFMEILDEHLDEMTEEDKFLNFQYMNFGLKRPVKTEMLEVYEIKYSGNIGKRDFEYNLVKY